MGEPRALELPSSALPVARLGDGLSWLGPTLLASLVGVGLALAFAPFQQSVRGHGRVIAYAPLERQQAVEAPIAGRVRAWYVQEGERVDRGQPIADISDNDPEILRRLRRQRNATVAQIDAARLSISMTEAQITSLQTARSSAVANAKLRVQMAQDRQSASARAVDAAEARVETAELNVERQRALQQEGLASRRELELAELEQRQAHTELDRARAARSAARAEVQALAAEQARVASANAASIESTQAALEKLRADRAKLEGELARVEVRLARQEQMQVVAPRAGTILRLLAKQDTEMVKAGDPLVLLVPEAGARAVELFVDGNDAPLLDEGREVRLQFEGWPAVQFVGWPSVAVGTFPGRVDFVDAHGDEQGRFRVVVVPRRQHEWPSGHFLRQGVRANGWVLLDQVTLGFELWRIFNGFPAAVTAPSASGGASK